MQPQPSVFTGLPAFAGNDEPRAMPDIKSLTAAELLRVYRRGELSPVEVTRDQLDRIEQFQPALNAFIIIDRDGAYRMFGVYWVARVRGQ